jgi:hypothetical protein
MEDTRIDGSMPTLSPGADDHCSLAHARHAALSYMIGRSGVKLNIIGSMTSPPAKKLRGSAKSLRALRPHDAFAADRFFVTAFFLGALGLRPFPVLAACACI